MHLKDIEKLALLARIELSEAEKISFSESLESILKYVSQIQSVATTEGTDPEVYMLQNVMREDDMPNKSGEYTDSLLQEAPETKDGFVKVKQIL